MNLGRLLRMRPAEISCRARQEVSKWMDRHAPALRPRPESWKHAAASLPSKSFFPSLLADGATAELDRRAPEARQRIVGAAEALLQGRFDLLGYRDLRFGDPLDWHLDPISGRRAPLAHWSRLDPLDAATLGDSKVIWELNRHQWMARLGQAYRLTGDERFAAAFARHVTGWIEANPPGVGINWASSLEVAFRVISWSWALHLFRGASPLTGGLRAQILAGLWSHAAHVERYLSHYFSPNTHLTGEALGLVYAGVLFPDLPRAERWRTLGARILERESGRQILADGVYVEQSTCYHRYTAEIYLHFVLLARQGGLEVSILVTDRIQRLLDALLALMRPDGSLPQIGDADGGRLLPLDRRAPDDAGDVFSTAAVVFQRSDYAWAAQDLAPETLWLLGPAAAAAFDSLRPAPPSTGSSRALADGGYVVMRTGWQRDADQVIFDVGPLGCQTSAGHGHADLLSVQCAFDGRPYLVDPGTFRYTADHGWRGHFRGTAAHSTVEVDGTGQAMPGGPFRWESHPRARLLRWESRSTLDVAEAEHHAYARLSRPVVHRRRVILAKRDRYAVIVDDLAGAGEHRLDVRFQLAPMPVSLDPDSWVRAGSGSVLLIRAFASHSLKVSLREGEEEPRQGWVSPDYGVRTPAPLLVYSAVALLPVRVVTLLLPWHDLGAPPPVGVLARHGLPVGLSFEHGPAVLHLDAPVPGWEAR